MLNIEEWIAGTHATNPASCFAVQLEMSAAGLVLSFPALEATGNGYAGMSRHYALERCTTQEPHAWHAVPGLADIPGMNQLIVYTNTAPGPRDLYRGRVWLETD
ncbi:MAG: hypothetical protein JXR37_05925 [Kiritimatiellae bacterium]|nr:hypothetical protein [Kiritimatiellia bacterium]